MNATHHAVEVAAIEAKIKAVDAEIKRAHEHLETTRTDFVNVVGTRDSAEMQQKMVAAQSCVIALEESGVRLQKRLEAERGHLETAQAAENRAATIAHLKEIAASGQQSFDELASAYADAVPALKAIAHRIHAAKRAHAANQFRFADTASSVARAVLRPYGREAGSGPLDIELDELRHDLQNAGVDTRAVASGKHLTYEHFHGFDGGLSVPDPGHFQALITTLLDMERPEPATRPVSHDST